MVCPPDASFTARFSITPWLLTSHMFARGTLITIVKQEWHSVDAPVTFQIALRRQKEKNNLFRTLQKMEFAWIITR